MVVCNNASYGDFYEVLCIRPHTARAHAMRLEITLRLNVDIGSFPALLSILMTVALIEASILLWLV